MASRGGRDSALGAMFALALIILALGVMAVGGESGLFFRQVNYVVLFAAADGLVAGAPVRMAGVTIGTVRAIRLPTEPTHQGIEVELGIAPEFAARVRDDSRAALRILQVLTNEKFVEILPGSSESPQLAPGSEIPPLEQAGLMERGEAIADSISEIIVSLKNILGPLQEGEGLVGRMLHDPEFGREGLETLGRTLENLEGLTRDLSEGRGVAGRLLQDEALAAKLDDLGQSMEIVARLTAAIERREGALGRLIEDDGPAEQMILDLRETMAVFRRVAAGLEAEDSVLGQLLRRSDCSEQVGADLCRALADLAEVAAKINRGEGTLGALVNERVLYDGAEDVVAGVNDSKFARWLLRHYQKKGIKAEEAPAEESESDEDAAPDAESPQP